MRIFAIALVIIITSCGNDSKVTIRQNQRDSSDHLIEFSSDDRKMNAAMEEARASFPDFLRMLNSDCKECDRFNVKMRFEEGETIEHIWLDNLEIKDGSLVGLIANEPENITNIRYGDTVSVRKEMLSDWMYVQNGRLVGGYTVKVMYDQMNETEKKTMENEFGAKIR